jgi:ureidoglycolate lyase
LYFKVYKEDLMAIHPMRISSDNFRPFGRVVTVPEVVPTAEGETFKFWSNIADYLIEGETEIGICTVYRTSATEISGVERHMRTPELLIPIDAPFILPLAAEDGSVSAYFVDIGEAVVIDRAVWHGPCLPGGTKESSYFVIFRKGTPHTDVEKKTIPAEVIDTKVV